MTLFRNDNTEGYTIYELNALNAEWQERVDAQQLEENTDEYDNQASWFCDEVARR